MAWTERQTALLRAMGLRTWSAPVPAAWQDGTAVRDTSDVDASVPAAPQDTAPTSAPLQRADAGPDWPALRAAVAACTACALHAGRTQPVFGSGAAHAHWMVVGDAPDAHDDAAGEPFSGPAGRLLDAMLHALGLARGDGAAADPARSVHVVNATRCRPPRGRNPAPDEIDQCRPYLQRQIDLVQPRVLLAMGRFAIQSLLKSDAALGQLRARVHTAFGVPTVVTYHPAYLARNPDDKARAWDDLCLAAAVADGSVSPASPASSSAASSPAA